MKEAACEWDEPEKTEQERNSGDDFDVDESGERQATTAMVVVKVGSDDTCDDLTEIRLHALRNTA